MSKRELFSKLLDRTALGAGVRRLYRWNGLVVLNYHRVGNWRTEPWDRDLFSAQQDSFARQVRFLKSNFDVVGIDDLADIEKKSGRYVQITFDDGYRDNHDVAYPILRAERATATFFVCTGFIDHGGIPWWDELAWIVNHAQTDQLRSFKGLHDLPLRGEMRLGSIRQLNDLYDRLPDDRRGSFLDELAQTIGSQRCPASEANQLWMNWEMVKSMHQGGMSIGGHTLNHVELSRHNESEQLQEILGSCQRITEMTGAPVKTFSFPYGAPHSFNDETRKALAQAGIQYGYSYYGGYQQVGRWDRYNLLRVPVEVVHSEALFKATLTLPSLLA